MRGLIGVCLLVLTAQPLARCGWTPNQRFVVDSANDRVLRLDAAGGVAEQIGVGVGLAEPRECVVAPDGHLLVTSSASDEVFEFDAELGLIGKFGPAAGLSRPHGLAIGPFGELYVASEDQDVIFELSADGSLVNSFGGGGLASPRGLAVGGDGHLYVASFASDRVLEFSRDGALVRAHGVGGLLAGPQGVAFTASGRLLVASSGNHTLVLQDHATGGEIAIGAGAGMTTPIGCAPGPDGRLYAGDSSGRLFWFDPDGALAGSVDVADAGALTAVAFAPVRLAATLQGEARQQAAVPLLIDEDAELQIFVGAGRMSLRLDPVAALAMQMQTATLVLVGGEAAEDIAAGKRLHQAAALGAGGELARAASLQLVVKGGVKGGAYLVASAAGALQAAAAGSIVTLKVKAKQPLP